MKIQKKKYFFFFFFWGGGGRVGVGGRVWGSQGGCENEKMWGEWVGQYLNPKHSLCI